jgi:hypothetical protein
VAAATNATISAAAGGTTRSATLAIGAAAPGPRTFGYATLAGFAYAAHNWPLADNEQVQPASLSEPGTLTSLRTYFYSTSRGAGSATRVRGIIYADAGGVPGRLIAVTPEVTNIVAGAWRELPLTTPVALTPGAYWIGIWGDSSQDAVSIDAHNLYKPVTYSTTGAAQDPWIQNGDPGWDGLVHRPICGVYTPSGSTPPAVALSSVTITPTAVVGGASATGTVTLTGAAPSGGLVVSLLDDSGSVTAPASVTVAAGSTAATFSISTSPVTVAATATLSASQGGVTRTASLSLLPPSLASIVLSPVTVVGGSTSTGTVTLNGAAPAGGSPVALTSSNTAAATVPATVTVPAGATSATFTVTTVAVATSTPVTISGASGGATQTAALTVGIPPSPVLTLSPVALTFRATVAGSNPAAQSITVSNTGGGALAAPAAAVSYGTGSGWLTVTVTGAAAPYTITVTPSITGLPVGTYTASIGVTSAGATGSPATAPVTLTVSAANVTPTVHAGFPISAVADNSSAATIVSPSFTPPAGTQLFALVMAGRATRNISAVAGGGLTWTRSVHSATADGAAAIFTAVTGASPLTMTATATLDVANPRSIVVYAFDGAATTAGASAAFNTLRGTLAVAVTPQASSSVILCAAANAASSTAFTVRSGSAADYRRSLTRNGNSHMACRSTGAVTLGQAYTVGSSAPTTADGNIVAIEVRSSSP